MTLTSPHSRAVLLTGMLLVSLCCSRTAPDHFHYPSKPSIPALNNLQEALKSEQKLSLTRAVLYIVMQCLGAICGAGVIKGFEGTSRFELNGGGANVVNPGYTKGYGLGAEIVGTFILVYTQSFPLLMLREVQETHMSLQYRGKGKARKIG